MECERLQKLIKNWYIQVQGESMAPARMVEFMRNHIVECLICMADPVVETEIKRITEIVLPPSKIPKALRKDDEHVSPDDEEEGDDSVEDDEEETEDAEEEEEDEDDPDLDEV